MNVVEYEIQRGREAHQHRLCSMREGTAGKEGGEKHDDDDEHISPCYVFQCIKSSSTAFLPCLA
jgi:hypothetical protein